MDREMASFERAVGSVQQVFGRGVVPLQLPIGEEKRFRGVIDLVSMEAHVYQPGGDGKAKGGANPAELAEAAKEAHQKLGEPGAEGDCKMMEEVFAERTLPLEGL